MPKHLCHILIKHLYNAFAFLNGQRESKKIYYLVNSDFEDFNFLLQCIFKSVSNNVNYTGWISMLNFMDWR